MRPFMIGPLLSSPAKITFQECPHSHASLSRLLGEFTLRGTPFPTFSHGLMSFLLFLLCSPFSSCPFPSSPPVHSVSALPSSCCVPGRTSIHQVITYTISSVKPAWIPPDGLSHSFLDSHWMLSAGLHGSNDPPAS